LRLAVVAALAVVAIVAAVRLLRPVEVGTVALELRDIERTLVVVGRVRPFSRAGLGATVAGVVQEVRVREGDRVQSGDLLVRLDDREALAALGEAESALVETTAAVKAEAEQAELEWLQAERDLERFRAVFAQGALTQQVVEQGEQRAADARSRLEAARAPAGASGTNAAVLRATATLDAARARWALTRITAPAEGTVLRRLVEPGDAIQPGAVLVEIAAEGPAEVVTFPSEENLGRLVVGARAVVSADAYPDDVFEATITRIAPSVDPSQGTVEVRLSLDDPPSYLRPEMTLSVNIAAGYRTGASVLPADAVRGLGTAEPWVALVRDGRLEQRALTLGFRGDAFVEVASGLEPGDRVVLGAGTLEPGTRVRVRPPG